VLYPSHPAMGEEGQCAIASTPVCSPQPPASVCWPRGLPEPSRMMLAERTPGAVARLPGRPTGPTMAGPPSSSLRDRPGGRALPISHSTAAPPEATPLNSRLVVAGARAATGATMGPLGTVPLKARLVVAGTRAAGAKAGTPGATPLSPRPASTPGIALAVVRRERESLDLAVVRRERERETRESPFSGSASAGDQGHSR
jgi:hypothetical protein